MTSTAALTLECRQARDTVNALLDFLDDRRDIPQAHRSLLRFDLDRALVTIPELDRAVDRRPAIGLLAPVTAASDVLVASLAGVREPQALGQVAGSMARLPVLRGLLPTGDQFGFSTTVRLTHEAVSQAAAKAADTVGRMMGGNDAPRRPVEQGLRIELVSLADVMLILARAALTQVRAAPDQPTVADVRAILAEIAANDIAAAPQAGLPAHHITAMRLYLEQRFRDHPRLQLLTAAGFWEQFTALAPRATPEGRRRLAGLLWGGAGDFDTVYGELAGALDSLNHATDLMASIDAVRASRGGAGWGEAHPFSILAAGTLLSTADAAGELLEVRTRFGQPVAVARNILTALARDVTITVEGDATALLARVDMVQLPTATPSVVPRGHIAQPGLAAVGPSTDAPWLARAFTYAKSLHLAETAVAGFDLTGLVVHLDASAPLSPHFAPIVAHWIEQTQGQSPQAREANDTTLFVAVDAASAVSPLEPLKAFLGGVSRTSAWLDRWGTDSTFDNLFILGFGPRATGPAIAGQPLGRLPAAAADKGTALATLETARVGLQSGHWQRHVRNAAVAVDEALNSGDGGVVYLAQSISAIDYARAKRRQITARLVDTRSQLADTLDRFLYASAPDAANDWRHRAALSTQARLRTTANEQRIGHLIQVLTPPERTLALMFERLVGDGNVDGDGEGLMRRLAALDRLDETSAEQLARRFAGQVIGHWLRAMRIYGLAPGAAQAFGFAESNFGHLIEEIALGADRAGLESRITAAVTRVLVDTRAAPGGQAGRVAMVCADALTGFVSQLGFDQPWSSRHPRRRGTLGAPLFERQAAAGPEDLATLQSGRITLQYTADWCEAFGLMTEETIAAARGMRFEEGEFRELSELLSLLSSSTRDRVL